MKRQGIFYWSLRREIWENRSLYLAPLAIAAVILAAFLYHSPRLADAMRGLAALQPSKQLATVAIPFGIAASAILVTGWLVGVFYCLDALNGERRDRSILFWKSMPVSDLATVGSKVAIALAVVPAIATAVAFATQVAMLLAGSVVIAVRDAGSVTLLSTLPFATMTLVMLYGVFVHILWFAPIYAWLLLVSGWARRATFAWAFLPFFAAFAVEKIAFGTHQVGPFIRYRITGAMGHAFAPNAMKEPITELAMLTPERFFAAPGLWLGLLFAAACIAAAVRLRRYREPI